MNFFNADPKVKYQLLLVFFFLLLTACTYREHSNSSFNEELSVALGADANGMKTYVLAFLIEGPVRDQNAEVAADIQKGHMEHIQKLSESGKLVLAGPFLDKGPLRGIFLFDTESMEEARQLTESDPAVISGRLQMELHRWYGSAAIVKINEIHSALIKSN
jgi:uncharacterized protein